MSMNLKNPLVVQFNADNQDVVQNGDVIMASVTNRKSWYNFKNATESAMKSGKYDSVVMSFRNIGQDELSNPDIFKSADIHARQVLSLAYKQELPVFNRFQKQMYFLNPTFDVLKNEGSKYVVPDQTVLDKRDQYPNDFDWQKHQADINKKFAIMMPLTSGQPFEKTNHKKELLSPKRGLNEDQIKDFFSWRSNVSVIPELMGDNMVGMPAMRATAFKDVSLEYHGRPVESTPLNIKTSGSEGFVIPMRNTHGDAAKSQIGTDISPYNLNLKARAADGVSIQSSEIFDNKTREYKFKFTDGTDTHLHAEEADNDHIIMEDSKGQFPVSLKKDIKPLLQQRGYDVPELIDTLKPEPAAKYIWPSRGDMVGSGKINNTKHESTNRIIPSLAGFITAKEPDAGNDEYIVVVTEGALKGTIAAAYMNVKDKDGKSMADVIAGKRGVIMAQVPGVAKSFVASVDRVYNDHKVAGTLIAMDADGRDNKAVAKGIRGAYKELSKHGPVKVMSWNPDHKGLDDSMLAVARGELTYHNMGIHYGTPDQLFPLDKATQPIPYKLDGSKAYTENNNEQWKVEYSEKLKAKNAATAKAQKESADVDVRLDMDDLTDTQDDSLIK